MLRSLPIYHRVQEPALLTLLRRWRAILRYGEAFLGILVPGLFLVIFPLSGSDGTIESVPQYPEDAYYANAIPNRMSLSNRHRSQPVVSFNCKHSVSTPSNHYPRDVSMFYPTTPVPSSDIGTQGPIASSGNSFSRTKQSPSSRNPLFPRGCAPFAV